MKHLLPTLFASLFCAGLFAQNFTAKNSFTAGSVGIDDIRDIATDANGNIYITGSFTDSIDFDPGPGTFYLSTPTGNKADAFIQKLDANGNFLWAQAFRGLYNDIESGERLLLDDSGNVYLQGRFQRNIFIDGYYYAGHPGGTVFRPFLTKIDSLGNIKWGMGWDAPLYPNGMTLDENANIYLAGLYAGPGPDTADVNPGADTLNVYSIHGGDAFILKVLNSGLVSKAHCFGGLHADLAQTVTSNGHGGLYIGGTFSSTLDANFGSGVYNLTNQSSSGLDAFLICIDTSFVFKWAYRYGGQGFTPVQSYAAANGYLYNTGYFYGSRDFDPSPNTTVMLSSGASNNTSAFIQVLDTAGNFVWARSFYGTNGKSYPESFSLSTNNEILVGGYFEGTVDVNPDPNQVLSMTSLGAEDGFVVLLDSLGNLLAVNSFGGTGDDVMWATHFSQNNKMFAGGSFQNTIDLDPTPNTILVTSIGQEDMLFLELSLCTQQVDTLPVVACNYFVVPGDTVQRTNSGFYTTNLLGIDGCDSTIVFDVTINNIAPTVTQTIDGLAAQTQAPSPSYQWLNCSTGQIVPGATNQTFMPVVNGQYSVIVSDGTCTDTSACFTISNVSLEENELAKNTLLYPNPTSGLLHIKTTQEIQSAEITDLTGRTLLSQKGSSEALDLSALPSGVYVVKLLFENGVVTQKVVKE